MRSIKLVPALAAAAALVCLAPTGAAARPLHRIGHRHANAGSNCRTTLNVAPRLITAGESALAFGRLTCAPAGSEAGQPVTLYENATGSPVAIAGTGTTDTHGLFEITAPSITTNSSFYVVAGGAQSAKRSVRVGAQVSLSGPSEGTQLLAALQTGRRSSVTFSGSVSPNDAGADFALQRQNAVSGNEWRLIGHGIVTVGGTFSITHTFRAPGDANLRVVVRGNHRNAASASNVLTYEISQAQNPQLTINTSADPIAYGQSVTISGVATGAANAPLTLMARSASTHGFLPAAQVSTDGAGKYSFPAQSPLLNTSYEVRGAGKTSAVLYEGVKDTVTASIAPSTTIAAGETLTFSGAVSPDHSGHVVYLERQNAFGPSFHVVETGTLSAGSVYSIAHTVFSVGTSVFRIKIPGDGHNGATASQPFTVTVTPPKELATLTPEGPSNSSTPPTGQL
jgi:hypothetical protein